MTKTASSQAVRRLTFSAIFLALALVLPFLTGQIPEIGSMLCPMHLPVLLCGFICGWPWGLAVGFISPLLRCAIFGMPMPISAAGMAFEMAAYGAFSGLLYRLLPKRPLTVYITLVASMILGRLVWGVAEIVILGIADKPFTPAIFIAGAFTNAIPGIILQLVLVPIIVMVLERMDLTLN